jgi:predicted ABC-type ATPase
LPRLTIIAGPNGAGKSTSSKSLLQEQGIEAFDYDKEFYGTWKLFGYDPPVEQGVRESITEKFDNAIQNAIHQKTNFGFETNYHAPIITNILNRFKAAGFETELLFIALPSPEEAIKRVKKRVANGGHAVDPATIKERFEKGLELLNNTFKEYDSFTLFLSLEMKMDILVDIADVQKKVININRGIPTSLKSKLWELTTYLKKDWELTI